MATSSQADQPGQIFIRKSSGLTRQISAWDALMYCCLAPGWLWPFVYISWIPWLYPGAHMPIATFAIFLFFPIAGLYWLFSVAMSRSGGEYVYMSRILHPALGLMTSFIVSVVALSWCGMLTDWVFKWGFANFPRGIGLMTGDASWLAAGDFLGGEGMRTVLGTASILLTTFIVLKGARWMMRLSWISMIAAIGGLLTFAAAVITGAGNFAANWTELTGVDYNSIIQIATTEASYPATFTVMATLMGGATYVGLNTLGSTFSANLAGEIRGVQRSQLFALFGSLVVLLVIWFLVYQLVYLGVGDTWIGSLVALFNTGSASYPLGTNEPFPTLLVAIMTRNPIFVFLMAFFFSITAFGTATSLAFTPTRNMFAWAFDRMIPPGFADIDRRFRSPLKVIAVAAVLAELFLLIDIWQPTWMANAGYSIIAWFVGWMLLGIAGMLFPYVKRPLFESCPPLVKSMFLGVPVITWLGALTFLVSASVEAYQLWPLTSGALPMEGIYVVIAIIVAPILIYLASSTYYQGRGISLAREFEEVPPE